MQAQAQVTYASLRISPAHAHTNLTLETVTGVVNNLPTVPDTDQRRARADTQV